MLVQDTFTMIMKLINESEMTKKNIAYSAAMVPPYTCPLYSFFNYGAFTKQNNVKVLLDRIGYKRMTNKC